MQDSISTDENKQS